MPPPSPEPHDAPDQRSSAQRAPLFSGAASGARGSSAIGSTTSLLLPVQAACGLGVGALITLLLLAMWLRCSGSSVIVSAHADRTADSELDAESETWGHARLRPPAA
eukprot:5732727-Prymnesium_polylepis.1